MTLLLRAISNISSALFSRAALSAEPYKQDEDLLDLLSEFRNVQKVYKYQRYYDPIDAISLIRILLSCSRITCRASISAGRVLDLFSFVILPLFWSPNKQRVGQAPIFYSRNPCTLAHSKTVHIRSKVRQYCRITESKRIRAG